MTQKRGRPTKWSPELEQKAWDYVNHEWEAAGDMIPSLVGLCGYLGINKTTAYDWAKHEDKEFSNILDTIQEKQEKTLINNGLSGDFNSAITKLVLGKHGYHEKQDINNKLEVTSVEIPIFTADDCDGQ